MKFTVIFPPLGHGGGKVASIPLAPPVLEYLAGLISAHRPGYELRLVNANVDDLDVGDVDADVVGITVLTHQAGWAYDTADRLMKRGMKVVLGGPHPSVLPEEAKEHSDAVIIGESESIMEELLRDLERGKTREIYEGCLLPLEGLPHPRRDLLKGYLFHSFSTSRGCPYRCRFCVTPRLHGRAVRYRPVAEVVEDLAGFKHRMWFSTDADIWGPDVERYIELFREMSVSVPGRYWIGEGNLKDVLHPKGEELLKWARRSGLMQVWVGWESMDEETLSAYGTGPKMPPERELAIRKIRDSGIDVVLFLMLGAKGEPLSEYERVLDVTDRLSVTAHPVMVVPYPGTEMYDEMKDELVYGNDWDYFDGMHSVLRQERSNAVHDRALGRLWVELFTYPRILRRLASLSLKGLPSAHMASLMVQRALRAAFRTYIRENIVLP